MWTPVHAAPRTKYPASFPDRYMLREMVIPQNVLSSRITRNWEGLNLHKGGHKTIDRRRTDIRALEMDGWGEAPRTRPIPVYRCG